LVVALVAPLHLVAEVEMVVTRILINLEMVQLQEELVAPQTGMVDLEQVMALLVE
jgi:hypothetical protein